MRPGLFAAALLLVSASIAAHADTLAQVTGGTQTPGTPVYAGQSFAVVGSGSYTDVTFNFYSPAGAPFAAGTAFLFSTPYFGTPAGLSSSDAGFLASTAASGGTYNFGSSVTLTAGNSYYLYENALLGPNDISGGVFYFDGNFFYAQNAGFNFTLDGISSNFLVTGVPTATPEPSSMALLGTSVLGLAGIVRRRMARA